MTGRAFSSSLIFLRVAGRSMGVGPWTPYPLAVGYTGRLRTGGVVVSIVLACGNDR